jgi:hypothetical protein
MRRLSPPAGVLVEAAVNRRWHSMGTKLNDRIVIAADSSNARTRISSGLTPVNTKTQRRVTNGTRELSLLTGACIAFQLSPFCVLPSLHAQST